MGSAPCILAVCFVDTSFVVFSITNKKNTTCKSLGIFVILLDVSTVLPRNEELLCCTQGMEMLLYYNSKE